MDTIVTDALLWSLVRKFSNSSSQQPEDLMNEARAAAAFAIKKYEGRKSASVRTFICECVKNRLLTLDRKKRVALDFVEELPDEVGYSAEADYHFRITMRQLLSSEEYEMFTYRFVEDMSEREIATRLGCSRRKVKACITQLMQKYELIEKNHLQVSTQRRLSDRWLDDSPS